MSALGTQICVAVESQDELVVVVSEARHPVQKVAGRRTHKNAEIVRHRRIGVPQWIKPAVDASAVRQHAATILMSPSFEELVQEARALRTSV